MRIAIAGGSGSLGRALADAQRAAGHEVVTLLRAEPTRPGERRWDPEAGHIHGPGLSDVDAVVNLAGEPIAQRWTPAAKQRIAASRLMATLTIVAALEPDGRCQRLLNGSSCAIYGDPGVDYVDEDSPVHASGFLARVCVDWETSARHAPVPTVLLRSGHVLSPGAPFGFGPPGFRGGLNVRVGDGRQWVPWIHLDDWLAAVLALLSSPVEGPVNLTSPEPVQHDDLLRAMGRHGGRAASFTWPRLALVARFGDEVVREVLGTSVRALPRVLLEQGFAFAHPSVDAAMADLLTAQRAG